MIVFYYSRIFFLFYFFILGSIFSILETKIFATCQDLLFLSLYPHFSHPHISSSCTASSAYALWTSFFFSTQPALPVVYRPSCLVSLPLLTSSPGYFYPPSFHLVLYSCQRHRCRHCFFRFVPLSRVYRKKNIGRVTV